MTLPPLQVAARVRSSVTSAWFRRAVIELSLIAVLYVGYSASRLLASTEFAPARGHALNLLTFERAWRIDAESWLNSQFVEHDWLGLVASFWYATTHYAVTAVVLVWLYRTSASQYVTARRALVVATLIGLFFYLTAPTAPPRLLGGYTDVLSLHSAAGWWGGDASAPKGLGGLTNELAAFPSLHAGWALWVAVVLIRAGVPRVVQALGLLYALTMAVDVIGTANHWVVDVVVGWVVVLVGFALVAVWERRSPLVAHEELHLREGEPSDPVA
jgi:hypothetical protein